MRLAVVKRRLEKVRERVRVWNGGDEIRFNGSSHSRRLVTGFSAEILRLEKAPPCGLEQDRYSQGETAVSETMRAVGGDIDPDLLFIVEHWEELPRTARQQLCAMSAVGLDAHQPRQPLDPATKERRL